MPLMNQGNSNQLELARVKGHYKFPLRGAIITKRGCQSNYFTILLHPAFTSRNPFFPRTATFTTSTSDDLARICFASGLATIHVVKRLLSIHHARLTLANRASRTRLRIYDGETSRDPAPSARVSADYYVVKIIV